MLHVGFMGDLCFGGRSDSQRGPLALFFFQISSAEIESVDSEFVKVRLERRAKTHVCWYMKLIREIRMQRGDNKTDKTRFNTKRRRINVCFSLKHTHTRQHLLFETMSSGEKVQN